MHVTSKGVGPFKDLTFLGGGCVANPNDFLGGGVHKPATIKKNRL
jgi:hypothetical protein